MKCEQCGHQDLPETGNCPQCSKEIVREDTIPNYPRIKGGWPFMVLWVLFLFLIGYILFSMISP